MQPDITNYRKPASPFAFALAALLLLAAPAAPALEFESAPVDQTFTVGTAVSLTLPRTKLEGQCYHDGSSYTLTPTLPAGLSFNGDYNSRLISGTPTTATAQTQYTYSANNNACYQNTSDNFNITVVTAPDITLSASSVSVTEGGTGTYTVRLKDQPTGNVTVTVSSGDSGAVTASPASLTFTTGNYSTTQTVTLTGAQDADGADETVTITHTASGGGITGETATLTATVTDDDSLTAGSIGETSAILTNYKGSWYYKETAPSTGTCSSAGAGVSVNLTGLTAGTSYTYKAYSENTCTTELTTDSSVTLQFTHGQLTVPKMATPKLSSGNKRIILSWTYPQGVPGLQAYRVRYREKAQTGWTYADARSDSGEQNFYGHETGATIPAHEIFTMKDSHHLPGAGARRQVGRQLHRLGRLVGHRRSCHQSGGRQAHPQADHLELGAETAPAATTPATGTTSRPLLPPKPETCSGPETPETTRE